MTSLFRSRLFRQQFLAMSGLTAFFFGFMVAGILFRTQAAIERREAEIAEAYRDAVMTSLSAWLSERERDIAFMAEDIELLAASGAEVPYLHFGPFLAAKPEFSDLLAVDLEGHVLYGRAGPVTRRRVSLADRDYFQAARDGQAFISGVFRNRLTGKYAFAVSRPIRRDGRISEVLAGVVLLSDAARLVEEMGLRDLGSVYIVDADRRLVAGSRGDVRSASDDPAAEPPVLENQAAREVAQGGEGAGKYRTEGGSTVIGAYGWFPRLSLGVIVELRNDRALVPVTRLLEFSAVLAGGVLLILLVLSYLLSLRLVRPIQALAEAAAKLDSDEYSDVAVFRTGTEVDALVAAFNAMAHTVRDREHQLRETAARDSLTGLYNHAKIEEFLEFEVRRKKRDDQPVCFVMMDIDHFKSVNDTHGHAAGDAVLRGVADLLTRSCREGDIVGRYGGEEFAVILNSHSPEESAAFCERVRRAVEFSRFGHEGITIRITISLGFACASPSKLGPFELMRSADKALYAAKQAGRNQTVRSGA